MSGETDDVVLSRAQVREVDRLAIEQFHVPGIVLMENAARAVVDTALLMIPSRGNVTIVCGGGNNGGDGFAVARHLHNHRVHVRIVDASVDLKGDALTNFQIVERIEGIERYDDLDAERVLNPRIADLVIDALFGTGLARPLIGQMAWLVERMNASGVPILAVDVPSGLDCDTGEPLGTCIRAARTVTFVAPKIGFNNPAAKQYLGEVTVGDIGCPRELIARVVAQR